MFRLPVKYRFDVSLLFLSTDNVLNLLACLVVSIICRPYAVVDDEIGRQGSLPTVAPVNPYTEFALTL